MTKPVKRIKCPYCGSRIPLLYKEDENTEVFYCEKCKKRIYRIKTKTAGGKDKFVKATALQLPLRVYFNRKDGKYYAEFTPEEADEQEIFYLMLGIPYDKNKKRFYCHKWRVKRQGALAVLEIDGKDILVTTVKKL